LNYGYPAAIIITMSKHSIAETKNKITELIARAERGEEIVITRHGREVAKIVAVDAPAKQISEADLDWLAQRRKGRGRIPAEDAGTFVSRMRDKDWR